VTATGQRTGGQRQFEVAIRRSDAVRHYDVRVTELRRGGGLLAG